MGLKAPRKNEYAGHRPVFEFLFVADNPIFEKGKFPERVFLLSENAIICHKWEAGNLARARAIRYSGRPQPFRRRRILDKFRQNPDRISPKNVGIFARSEKNGDPPKFRETQGMLDIQRKQKRRSKPTTRAVWG